MDILRRLREPGALTVVHGIVTKNLNDETRLLTVRVPSFDELDEPPAGGKRTEHHWDCLWHPRVEPHPEPDGDLVCRIVWPVKGDRATVVFDDDAVPTVVTYWPKATTYERLPPPPRD